MSVVWGVFACMWSDLQKWSATHGFSFFITWYYTLSTSLQPNSSQLLSYYIFRLIAILLPSWLAESIWSNGCQWHVSLSNCSIKSNPCGYRICSDTLIYHKTFFRDSAFSDVKLKLTNLTNTLKNSSKWARKWISEIWRRQTRLARSYCPE